MAGEATKVTATFELKDDNGVVLDSKVIETPIDEDNIFQFDIEVENNQLDTNGSPIIRPKRPRI